MKVKLHRIKTRDNTKTRRNLGECEVKFQPGVKWAVKLADNPMMHEPLVKDMEVEDEKVDTPIIVSKPEESGEDDGVIHCSVLDVDEEVFGSSVHDLVLDQEESIVSENDVESVLDQESVVTSTSNFEELSNVEDAQMPE